MGSAQEAICNLKFNFVLTNDLAMNVRHEQERILLRVGYNMSLLIFATWCYSAREKL